MLFGGVSLRSVGLCILYLQCLNVFFLIFNKFGNTQSLPFFYKQNVHLWIQIHLPSRARLARSKDIVTTLVENIPIESLAVPVGGMESTKMMDAKRGGKQ